MLDRRLSKRLSYAKGVPIHPKRTKPSEGNLQEVAQVTVSGLINSKQWRFEERPCICCGSSQLDLISDIDRHSLYFPVALCRECGLVHANPVAREDDYMELYTKHYRRLYGGISGMPSMNVLKTKKNKNTLQAKKLLENEALRSKIGGTLLDVGCGGGNFTWAWQDLGFKATGIDLNGEYQDIARDVVGLDLHTSTLKDFTENRKFDVIFYNHVFEHIWDPNTEFQLAIKALNPGGILVIVVPGLRTAESKYWGDLRDHIQFAHISFFTKETLAAMAVKNGFDALYVDSHVRGIFQVSDNPQILAKNVAPADWRHYEWVSKFLSKLEREYGTDEAGFYKRRHAQWLREKTEKRQAARVEAQKDAAEG